MLSIETFLSLTSSLDLTKNIVRSRFLFLFSGFAPQGKHDAGKYHNDQRMRAMCDGATGATRDPGCGGAGGCGGVRDHA
jgi:hypothetical protein